MHAIDPLFAGSRLGAGSRRPVCHFRLGDAAPTTRGHRTESPFTAGGRCILPKSVAGETGSKQRTDSCLTSCYAQVGSERVEDADGTHANVRHCVEPRLVVSRTPRCHPPGPHRVGTTRYVRAMGRRSSRSTARRSLRNDGVSVTHPAKGEILVEIEVPSVRSTVSPTRG